MDVHVIYGVIGDDIEVAREWIEDLTKLAADARENDNWGSEQNVTGRPLFVSDNNGFDWQFVNWYFWRFTSANPFGHSSSNLGSLYKGLVKDTRANFKHLRKTRHTHDPVDDAKGNAEAMLAMQDKGLRF